MKRHNTACIVPQSLLKLLFICLPLPSLPTSVKVGYAEIPHRGPLGPGKRQSGMEKSWPNFWSFSLCVRHCHIVMFEQFRMEDTYLICVWILPPDGEFLHDIVSWLVS
jgi:hypothetical protein